MSRSRRSDQAAAGPPGRWRRVAGPEPWRAAGYLLAYCVVGTVLFTAVVTVVLVAGVLALVGVGLPLLAGAAAVGHGAAHVERQRAAMAADIDDRAVAADGPPEDPDANAARGPVARMLRPWTEPGVWRRLGYLVGLYPVLLVLDVAAVSLWLSLLAGTTIPLWYWAVPNTYDSGATLYGLAWGHFPHGPDGPGAVGLFIDDPLSALLGAALCAALFVAIASPLVMAAARLHARIAVRLLGPPVDPLADARAVLRRPGPLAWRTPHRRGHAAHLSPVPPAT